MNRTIRKERIHGTGPPAFLTRVDFQTSFSADMGKGAKVCIVACSSIRTLSAGHVSPHRAGLHVREYRMAPAMETTSAKCNDCKQLSVPTGCIGHCPRSRTFNRNVCLRIWRLHVDTKRCGAGHGRFGVVLPASQHTHFSTKHAWCARCRTASLHIIGRPGFFGSQQWLATLVKQYYHTEHTI